MIIILRLKKEQLTCKRLWRARHGLVGGLLGPTELHTVEVMDTDCGKRLRLLRRGVLRLRRGWWWGRHLRRWWGRGRRWHCRLSATSSGAFASAADAPQVLRRLDERIGIVGVTEFRRYEWKYHLLLQSVRCQSAFWRNYTCQWRSSKSIL